MLLHSSAHTGYSGSLSILAVHPLRCVDAEHFDALSPLLTRDQHAFANAWFGYLSYEMKHDAEDYPRAAKGRYQLPPARFLQFSTIFVFDHVAKTLTLYASDYKEKAASAHSTAGMKFDAACTDLSSNMTRAEYERKVTQIIEAIAAGHLYQAILTRKFYGQWDTKPDGLALFAKLCSVSPAPYSAYMRFAECEILSSSPEMFLHVSSDGRVITRPIKGSAPRGKDAASDQQSRDALAESEKNRAENLMITDLMRNDVSRVCAAGSVQVDGLFELTTHATIHHMASTVRGQLTGTIPELLRATFPPGSMTGCSQN